MSTTLDLLSDACLGLPYTARKMFGGHGFFAPNGGMFAGILSDTEVMLKLVAGPERTELISLGGHPWTYTGKAKPMTMQEWIVVPESFFDDPELFAAWAKRAHAQVPPKKLGKANPRRTRSPAKAPARVGKRAATGTKRRGPSRRR
ncbi:MAG: TfoX/Sxy family protein [Myxococcaceae bacterium]|nr:TfoX/Sxy family protein [Myxococcaceae bacterium]